MHFLVQYLQRGPNLQPLGSARGCGTTPGMGSRRSLSISRRGMESMRPSVYGWLHWGLITDAELTKDVAFLENGHVVLSVGKENCGYGLPVAPIKKKDGGTTSSQYYLCIPSAEKIPQIADYTGLDAALAAVPEDLGEYTEESAKAVTDAVAAVSDPIFRYKSEAEQADIDALEPRVLILDEAFAMLDEAAEKQMLEVLRCLKEQGTAILAVEHEPRRLAAADRVLRLADGRLEEVGP